MEKHRFALVSEWMGDGTINDFIQKHTGVNRVQLVCYHAPPCRPVADRLPQLVDVAHGLEYLHSFNFAHGDLKGVRKPDSSSLGLLTDSSEQVNILIRSDHRACLADFGLSTIVCVAPRVPADASASSVFTGATAGSETSLMRHTAGGTYRWMSPELLDPERFGLEYCKPTKESDCYALGMVIYEVRSHSVAVGSLG